MNSKGYNFFQKCIRSEYFAINSVVPLKAYFYNHEEKTPEMYDICRLMVETAYIDIKTFCVSKKYSPVYSAFGFHI